MKRILISLAVIAVVGAAVATATGAFYNDTEASNGNIFTAGSIDLKVDHLKQTYNGVDCKTCSVTVISDETNMITEKNGSAVTPFNAVVVTPTWVTDTYWTASSSPAIANSKWIWANDPISQSDVDNDTTYTFVKTFTWLGPITGATLSFGVAADNSYEVYLNGNLVNADTNENNFGSADVLTLNTAWFNQGTNTLTFKVKNWHQPGPTVNNPAALRYALSINGNCGDDYFKQQCRLWTEKDLGQGDTFFNFNDVKPGDFGTNVISLHVYDNDAYACLLVNNKDDEENTIYGPETAAGDNPTSGNPNGYGELSNYVDIFTWIDTNGNGLFEPGETALMASPVSLHDAFSLASLDPSTHMQLTATTTEDIGLAWCAGTLTIGSGGVFTCDGSGMHNDAQSDSFSATLTAYAEQVRNNPNFSCATVPEESLPQLQ